jgi:hypothetical protein
MTTETVERAEAKLKLAMLAFVPAYFRLTYAGGTAGMAS